MSAPQLNYPRPRSGEPAEILRWAGQLIAALVQRHRPWAAGQKTLAAAPATTTVISDERIRAGDTVIVVPGNAAAAAGGVFAALADVEDGSFTVTHAATSDQVIAWVATTTR
jgi:hypothetical protein